MIGARAVTSGSRANITTAEDVHVQRQQVIDTDGHVMEPNDLYDRYLEAKFKPDLEDLKKEAESRPSKFFFGIFHQLNTGRPLGVPHPDSR